MNFPQKMMESEWSSTKKSFGKLRSVNRLCDTSYVECLYFDKISMTITLHFTTLCCCNPGSDSEYSALIHIDDKMWMPPTNSRPPCSSLVPAFPHTPPPLSSYCTNPEPLLTAPADPAFPPAALSAVAATDSMGFWYSARIILFFCQQKKNQAFVGGGGKARAKKGVLVLGAQAGIRGGLGGQGLLQRALQAQPGRLSSQGVQRSGNWPGSRGTGEELCVGAETSIYLSIYHREEEKGGVLFKGIKSQASENSRKNIHSLFPCCSGKKEVKGSEYLIKIGGELSKPTGSVFLSTLKTLVCLTLLQCQPSPQKTPNDRLPNITNPPVLSPLLKEAPHALFCQLQLC
ncbi:hypothetical protein VP01_371g1 [Puccinia sorghi]|uniref:Uncharacterized protein n=1 Tax=Puccinia sorghi TaxID=27349 RepID=A0A0L6UU11_9BASI|nr:hypothetical protein VP01_371g1 [Puccinia sorghi]